MNFAELYGVYLREHLLILTSKIGRPMTEDELNKRLERIHARLIWIADTEARAAWIKGYGSNGEFDAERTQLIANAENVLDQLEAVGGFPKFQYK